MFNPPELSSKDGGGRNLARGWRTVEETFPPELGGKESEGRYFFWSPERGGPEGRGLKKKLLPELERKRSSGGMNSRGNNSGGRELFRSEEG